MAVKISTEEMPDDEMEALSGFLARVRGGEIPNVEALDGFLTALVISPDFIKPSEFMDIITKGNTEDGGLIFESKEEASRFFGILMNHWNRINRSFRGGDIYLPILPKDEKGNLRASDWAKGFLRGTQVRYANWAEVAESDEHGASFLYLWSLAYENHPDPAMRPRKTEFTDEERQDLIVRMIAGTKQLYDYFRNQLSDTLGAPQRKAPWADTGLSPKFSSSTAKLGRNDPCPCGSGKKFKKCCGAVVLH